MIKLQNKHKKRKKESREKLLYKDTMFAADSATAAIKNSISFILRKTDENKALFQNYSNFLRYRDYYELDKLIIGEK